MKHVTRVITAVLCFFGALPVAMADDGWEIIVPTLKRGEASRIQILPSGDLLIAGSATLTVPELTGGWIVRMRPTGEDVWSHEFPGDAHSRISDVKVHGEEIYVVGSHLVPNPTQADASAFVAKISMDGDLLWEKWLSRQQVSVYGTRVEKLKNGDILVHASSTSRAGDRYAVQYTRMNADGDVIWSYESTPTGKYYNDLPPAKSFLRSKDGEAIHIEYPGPVVEQPDGTLHFYMYRGELAFEPDLVIGRCEVVSGQGILLNNQECPTPDQVAGTQANNIAPYIASRVGPGVVTAKQIDVKRFNEAGDVDWTWTYQSENRAGLTDAVLTPDGGLIGVGFLILNDGPRFHRYEAIIFRLGPNGGEVWSHVYGSDTRDIFARIVALGDDQYIVVGHTGVKASAGWWDPWILKIGSDGVTRSAVSRR